MTDDSNAPIPIRDPIIVGGPSLQQITTYQTNRVQIPAQWAPMQSAMSKYIWAGSDLGAWNPLRGYGVNYAAPPLSQEQQAAFIRTQPMHNEIGYQMVLMKDNGVPIGGTIPTTPQYVTAGPMQPGYMSFVQPILRAEQSGGRGIPIRNPGPSIGPFCTHVEHGGNVWGACCSENPHGQFGKAGCVYWLATPGPVGDPDPPPPPELAGGRRIPKPTPTRRRARLAHGMIPTRRRLARAGRRRNPGPFSPVWEWNHDRTVDPHAGPGDIGPYAWPFVVGPPGYQTIGVNAGGWPIFSLPPLAPANLPKQVPKEFNRATGNPGRDMDTIVSESGEVIICDETSSGWSGDYNAAHGGDPRCDPRTRCRRRGVVVQTNPLPAALSGIPLLAVGLGVGAIAAGTTVALVKRKKDEEPTGRLRRFRPTKEVFRKKPPLEGTVTSVPQDSQEMQIMEGSLQQNPVVWPWIVAGLGAVGAGAYGAFRCSPGQRLFATDQMPGVNVTRILDYVGCFQEQPWRAEKITEVSLNGVPIPPVKETRTFANKRDAVAWLYTSEDPEQVEVEDNPRRRRRRRHLGGGRASRKYQAGAGPATAGPQVFGLCYPINGQAEGEKARAAAHGTWNKFHRRPTADEVNHMVNWVYQAVYPQGAFPIPGPDHQCATRWLKIRAIFNDEMAKILGTKGQAKGIAQNPIPGSVGYNGYFHGSGSIPGSVGYNGYDHGSGSIPGSAGYNPDSFFDVSHGTSHDVFPTARRDRRSARHGLMAGMVPPGTTTTSPAALTPRFPGVAHGAPTGGPGVVSPGADCGGASECGPDELCIGGQCTHESQAQPHYYRPTAASARTFTVPLGNRPQWSGARSHHRLTVNPKHGGACCASCADGRPCEGCGHVKTDGNPCGCG